jgi:predicted RNA-binding Zn ribbon-like protein
VSSSPAPVRHEFRPRDLVGGHPVIDFVNTVTARNTLPLDWLADSAALRQWASFTDLPQVPAPAEEELLLCRQFREALHATLSAVIDGQAVPDDAASTIQENWRQAASHAHLVLHEPPFALEYGFGEGVSALRHALAGAAIELLTDLPLDRLRRCPGDDCGWLFLDTSKAGRRRWCDMATCGTTDKNRRRRPESRRT